MTSVERWKAVAGGKPCFDSGIRGLGARKDSKDGFKVFGLHV